MITELHCHTTASDGLLSPAELVDLAVSRGVELLAITDHDTVSAWHPARRAADGRLQLLTGVELSCRHRKRDFHLLGYGFDPDHPELLATLARLQQERTLRLSEMIGRLRRLRVEVSEERIRELAAGESPGRPHLARALLEIGAVDDISSAFRRYLGRGKRAYVARACLGGEEAVALIGRAGGVAVLAHPGLEGAENLLEELVGWGLWGLEVYYPRHSPQKTRRFERLARELHLVTTGGSDYHGPEPSTGPQPGCIGLPEGAVERLQTLVPYSGQPPETAKTGESSA